jgi:hypothetical protein
MDGPRTPDCRSCGAPLGYTLVDLGPSPLCESYVPVENAHLMEPFYPLRVYVCARCFLVQLEECVPAAAIFREYAYFSSYADSWVEHCRRYCEQMCTEFGIGSRSFVVELASNDGYLLQHFVAAGVPVLGIEPAANVAAAAKEKGVPTLVRFFDATLARELAGQGRQADLVLGNNVLAQVPDLHDFVEGTRIVLAPHGILTLEFPHLVRLMEENQFDTIYHEHFSYFSFFAVERVLAAHGLRVFRVDSLPTHGGSLRIYGTHRSNHLPEHGSVAAMRRQEAAFGIDRLDTYARFEEQVKETKRRLLAFLIDATGRKKTVVGYGAPGKGNTLLNYCGIRTDFLPFTVDRNPYKQGKLLPGTRIPIRHPDAIRAARPDYVLILPWNLKDEIMRQMAYVTEWGGRFVVPIPEVRVYDRPRAGTPALEVMP